MFYIPMITTLVELVGRGEFFHPRSKLLTLRGKISGLLASDAEKELKEFAPYYQIKANSPEEAKKIHDQMLQYIKEHHLIFRERKAKL